MSSLFDPVSLEIVWSRLIAIADEAAAALRRAAFSTVARESNDLACALLDAKGNLLAQSAMSVPCFLGCMPRAVRHFLRVFPPESLEPGDVIMTNDPWLATGHLPDVTMAKPIFHEGQLFAFSGTIAHLPDIGGRVRSPVSREVFEEGLRIPVSKLVRRGETNEALLDIMLSNVRVPEQVMGDLRAQLAANQTVEKRLVGLLEEQGVSDVNDFIALGTTIRGRSESAMRDAIGQLPDGDYSYKLCADGFTEPLVIKAQVSVTGGSIRVDYSGSSAQVDKAINTPLNYAYALTAYAVKCVLAPHIPNNEGCFEPVEVAAPEGCIFNPRFPAAVGARAIMGQFCSCAVLGALSEAVPDRVLALPGSPAWILTVSGLDKKGNPFVNHSFWAGGMGASSTKDGLSCTSFPTNVSNVPVEVLETDLPLLIENKQIREDSGGCGRHRGGCGQEVGIRVESSSPLTIRFVGDRTKFPPEGLWGGGPGAVAVTTLNGQPIDPKSETVVRFGDRILLRTAGGGSFGAPVEGASRDQGRSTNPHSLNGQGRNRVPATSTS
jgi:N-methylhydantoinase B